MNKSMKILLTWLVCGMLAATVFFAVNAQDRQQPTSARAIVSLMPGYQHWSVGDSLSLSQFSTTANAHFPVNRNLSMQLSINQATAGAGDFITISGDTLENFNGLGDIQVGATYRLRPANVVLGLKINLPTGKKELTAREFETATLLNFDPYSFRVPGFGQGFNLSPSISWVKPLNEQVIFGAGLAYLLKGGFKPVEQMDVDYNPGDELLLAGGLDFIINRTANASVDVVFFIYGKDKLGDVEVFQSGSQMVFNGSFTQLFGFNRLILSAHFRNKSNGDISVGSQFVTLDQSNSPNQFELTGTYNIRVNPEFYLGLKSGMKFFQESAIVPRKGNLFAVGLLPEIRLNEQYRLPIMLHYQLGSFDGGESLSGFEVRAGIQGTF